MPPKSFLRTLLAGLMVASSVTPAMAQIVIDGIVDKTIYVDQVSFRVRSAAGYTYTAELDGAPIATDVFIVALPNYHEVHVKRVPVPSGTAQEMLVRFIVRASERQDSEWGLYPWVPYPSINSADGEFAGAGLTIVAPQKYPQGLEVPMVAWVENAATHARVGVNGWVKAAALPALSFHVLRGVGSGYLPAASAGGVVPYSAEVGPLSVARQIEFEASTTWTTASGAVNASADWGENARVHVTGTITVAAGATLTIGAGSVLWLNSGVDLIVNGSLKVNGTRDRPVVFTPATKSVPWGGLIFRTATSRADISGAILFAGCANQSWFSQNPGSGSTHLPQQPLYYVSNGAIVSMTDTYLLDSHGQGGHGESSTINLTRSIYQRFLTGGEYNGCKMTVQGCAIIEFPSESEPFADDDGDAIYFTAGGSIGSVYTVTDTLIGWAHDDGIDSGSGAGGPVNVTGCWIEGDYHEGLAWSSDSGVRTCRVKDTVVTNCGQGDECGWVGSASDLSPIVYTDSCLLIANEIGARFGDNYDWTYTGQTTFNDTLILHNSRNVWTRDWDDWLEHPDHMHLNAPSTVFPSGSPNYLTDPTAPASNLKWDPTAPAQLAKLGSFLSTPAAVVGIGIATRSTQLESGQLADGVPVRLSTFTTVPVSVDYLVDASGSPLGSGTLRFEPGETVKLIALDFPGIESRNLVRVSLSSPVNGELTDIREITIARLVSVTVVPAGSRWKYFDQGRLPGVNWPDLGFSETGWKEGAAELGYNNSPVTDISFGPDAANKYPTSYFRLKFQVDDPAAFTALTIRLKRDDGGVVYLNSKEAFRSNMPTGTIGYGTYASANTTSETAFFTKDVDPADFLVAGENQLAVEVHQDAPDSSDLSFDLELVGKEIPGTTAPTFLRGDANGDGKLDISDPLKILFHLFEESAVGCLEALDANDSSAVDISDPTYILQYLFLGGPAPPAPFPGKGVDPTEDTLGCSG
jgi:hypothetical protein